jgi:transposase
MKTELARRLGVSRGTVYNWLGQGQPDRDLEAEPVRYSPGPPVPTKLDPYKGIIAARLEAFPDAPGLVQVRVELAAQRLFEEPPGYPAARV